MTRTEIICFIAETITFICLLVSVIHGEKLRKRATLVENKYRNLELLTKSYYDMYKNVKNAYDEIVGTTPVSSPTRVILDKEVTENAEL